VLEVRAATSLTLFYVKDGVPVFAEDGSAGDTLGRLLVRHGRLTQDQYVEVLEQSTSLVGESEQLLFGSVAVGLGFLSQAEVDDALRMQLRARLVALVRAESTERIWDPSPEALEEVRHFDLALGPLLMEAVRGFDDARVLPRVAPHFGRVVYLAAPPEEVGRALGLTEAERRFVGRIGGRPLAALLDEREGGMSASAVPRLLAALVVFGWLTESAPDRNRDGTPAEEATAKSTPAATRRSVKSEPAATDTAAAPARSPALESNPKSTTATPTVAKPKAEAEERRKPSRRQRAAARLRMKQLGRMVGAAKVEGPTVAPVVRGVRKSQIERRRRFYAERAFRQGRAHLDAAAFPQAAEAFRVARKHDEEDTVEFALCLAWAEYREGSGSRGRVEGLAKRALRRDRDLGVAHYVLGYLSYADGDEARAISRMRRAVEADGSLRDAQRILRLLRMRGK